MSSITYHLVAQSLWESLDPNLEYLPGNFVDDGFIHCTDGEEEMARAANMFYQSNPGPHLYLYIDKLRVRAPIRYDDPERHYPHIYGALNRDAIIAIRPAPREGDGTFLPPEPLEN